MSVLFRAVKRSQIAAKHTVLPPPVASCATTLLVVTSLAAMLLMKRSWYGRSVMIGEVM